MSLEKRAGARARRPAKKRSSDRAGVSKKPRANPMSGPGSIGIPDRVLSKLRDICRALPGAYEEPAWVGTRFMVRKHDFAHVVKIDAGWPPAYARAAGSDGPLLVLTFRTTDILRDALRDAGARFFVPAWGTRWSTKVVGLKLEAKTDWREVATLLTESHRLLAGTGATPSV